MHKEADGWITILQTTVGITPFQSMRVQFWNKPTDEHIDDAGVMMEFMIECSRKRLRVEALRLAEVRHLCEATICNA